MLILEGKGLMLCIDDTRERELLRQGEPFRFAGETKIVSRLLDGPVMDFNPDFPLGGTSCLFACWRCLFGHFGRLLRANRTTIGLSQPTKLPQKSIRHQRKP